MAPQWAAVLARVQQLEESVPGGSGAEPVQTEYLWPCNQEHWRIWQELRTQWRVGVSGITGLDYAGMRAHLEVAHGLRGQRLRSAWQAMRACEEGALEAMAEAASKQ